MWNALTTETRRERAESAANFMAEARRRRRRSLGKRAVRRE